MVSAHHPVSVGPIDFEPSPFTTMLRFEDGKLVDRNEGDPLVFRWPREAPAAAREVLERDVERIHTGGCAAVYRQMELAPGAPSRIEEICDLVARSRDLAGRYQGLEMERVETFDVVPHDFPNPASETWIDRPGVLFNYKIRFERQDLYGAAIVWRKEGVWLLAYLW